MNKEETIDPIAETRGKYNVKILMPLILCALLLISVLLYWLIEALTGNVHLGTQRFYFFLYVSCLLGVGCVVHRKFAFISYALLCWCALELGVAISSASLEKYRRGRSLYPKDYPTSSQGEVFVYHPLLHMMPKPNIHSTWYMDPRYLRNRPGGFWVKISLLAGRQITLSHNSLGIRGAELSASDLSKKLIFVYGGSTTYDIFASQGQTWVELAQKNLRNEFTLLNLGVTTHSTTQHLIETALYQDIVKKKPVCAVYYVGWNDIANAHLESLDPAYADYHIPLNAVRRPNLTVAQYSPIARIFNDWAKRRFDSIPQAPQVLGAPTVAGSDEFLERIFAEHVRTIIAINRSRGIRSIFIGQILNRESAQDTYMSAPRIRKGDFWPLQERFNSILRETAMEQSEGYIDVGIENFSDNDFFDLGHFTPEGSRKFANSVSADIGTHCR